MFVTDDDIVQAVGDVPKFNVHCSALGALTLAQAVMNYFKEIRSLGPIIFFTSAFHVHT